jgi:hypothetical protein
MKILLDECTPHLVKRRLPAHDISTVQEMGWAGVTNGELLKLAEPLFDVFIKNLRFQQNLGQRKLAFSLLPSIQVPVVDRVVPAVEALLATIREGAFVEIPMPSK